MARERLILLPVVVVVIFEATNQAKAPGGFGVRKEVVSQAPWHQPVRINEIMAPNVMFPLFPSFVPFLTWGHMKINKQRNLFTGPVETQMSTSQASVYVKNATP